MDPFIESRRIWADFHLDLAAEIRAHLNAHIQPGYYATAVTYVTYEVIEVTQSTPRAASPDVSVWRTDLGIPTRARGGDRSASSTEHGAAGSAGTSGQCGSTRGRY